jgi:hypothetical protein
VGRAGADQEATRLFLCYHLLTQGGIDLTPRWHTASLSQEPPIIPPPSPRADSTKHDPSHTHKRHESLQFATP